METPEIDFRLANERDVDLYFNWANDPEVRKNAFQQSKIEYNNHINWFKKKLSEKSCKMYIFFISKDSYIGQIRIDKQNQENVIDISIDKHFRGKKLGVKMLKKASEDYFKLHPNAILFAYVKKDNAASLSSFKNANFKTTEELLINEMPTIKLALTNNIFQK